jgi:hypothetical protein
MPHVGLVAKLKLDPIRGQISIRHKRGGQFKVLYHLWAEIVIFMHWYYKHFVLAGG